MGLPVIGGSDGAWGTTLNSFLGGADGAGVPTIPNDRIPYLSGGNHTSSSNLTFNGTTLTVPAAVRTASAALTITPAAGTNFNIALSTTGDFVVNTNQLYVDTSAGFVGIGKLPTATLDVESTGTWGMGFRGTFSATLGGMLLGSRSIGDGAIQAVDGPGNNTNLSLQPSGGNLGLGSTAWGVGAVKVFTLGNGTAPGALASTASIVALAGEMWAYDSGGLGTQLSAHPADFLATLSIKTVGPYALPWTHRTKSTYLGKEIKVDMAGIVEAVEILSGKKFTTLEDLPLEERRDWDTDQEEHRLNRETEITAAQSQIVNLDTEIAAETDLEKKTKLTKQRNAIQVPAPYVKQRPQKWMVDRGVKTTIVEQ